ncbi:MAG: sodium:proton antiporter [Holosporales bacterium]|nr:sodium:proton antiporter [Holosporales bacterium]
MADICIFDVLVLSLPLIFLLLSLALLPLICSKLWHKYELLIFACISVVSIASFILTSRDKAIITLEKVIVDDYIPFIITLFTLYVLSHGIRIVVRFRPTTMVNLVFLGCGSVLSSIIGTTGASMLLLKPFLEMNKPRHKTSHLVIFFIFLISNIGGLMTPLGDPPLLIGYLKGIDFLWEIENLHSCWLMYLFSCLTILYFIDKRKLVTEKRLEGWRPIDEGSPIVISGMLNVFLILTTVAILFIDTIDVLSRNILLTVICVISIIDGKRSGKTIDLGPFREVLITFFVIFIVIAPVLHVLEVNSSSIHAKIAEWSSSVSESTIYFTMCALASSFLDNAPSYLLFFNMAGGNAQELMTTSAGVLKAISVSAVVMGSMTYIGNAPNMMVKSIAKRAGIEMPSFLGYIGWTMAIILPISIGVLLATR